VGREERGASGTNYPSPPYPLSNPSPNHLRSHHHWDRRVTRRALSRSKSLPQNQLEYHDALVIATVQVRVRLRLTVHATVVGSVGRDGPWMGNLWIWIWISNGDISDLILVLYNPQLRRYALCFASQRPVNMYHSFSGRAEYLGIRILHLTCHLQ
jgi:hypothetical protein